MADIVPVEQGSEFLRTLELIESAGVFHIKGYKNSEIAQLLEITPKKVAEYVEEYKIIIAQTAESDPYFLERIQFNTVRALKELDEISKEAWETVTVATDNGMVTARIQALKLALEVSTKKAQLHNLFGSQQDKEASGDITEKVRKLETVNQIVSTVLKDVVSGCPRCSEMARVKLSEAFSIMQEFEDAEVVE